MIREEQIEEKLTKRIYSLENIYIDPGYPSDSPDVGEFITFDSFYNYIKNKKLLYDKVYVNFKEGTTHNINTHSFYHPESYKIILQSETKPNTADIDSNELTVSKTGDLYTINFDTTNAHGSFNVNDYIILTTNLKNESFTIHGLTRHRALNKISLLGAWKITSVSGSNITAEAYRYDVENVTGTIALQGSKIIKPTATLSFSDNFYVESDMNFKDISITSSGDTIFQFQKNDPNDLYENKNIMINFYGNIIMHGGAGAEVGIRMIGKSSISHSADSEDYGDVNLSDTSDFNIVFYKFDDVAITNFNDASSNLKLKNLIISGCDNSLSLYNSELFSDITIVGNSSDVRLINTKISSSSFYLCNTRSKINLENSVFTPYVFYSRSLPGEAIIAKNSIVKIYSVVKTGDNSINLDNSVLNFTNNGIIYDSDAHAVIANNQSQVIIGTARIYDNAGAGVMLSNLSLFKGISNYVNYNSKKFVDRNENNITENTLTSDGCYVDTL